MRIRALVILFVVLLIVPTILAAAPAIRHKGIVPIVGTTATFGTAQQPGFHTTITLYGKQSSHGRLVFHPAGQVANDDTDPSYPYACGFHTCITGDVGGILGKGPFIGSMDIIPDPGSDPTIPIAFTHIYYNQTFSGPSSLVPFGTDVPRLISDEWAARQQSGNASQRFIYIQGIDPAAFRTTLGMRTLTEITYSVTIVHNASNGLNETIVSSANLPADFTYFVPLDQVLGGRVLTANDDVRVDIESGSAIGFYSYTSNTPSNTPTFRLSEPLNDPVIFGVVP